jgi:hypothetical protein
MAHLESSSQLTQLSTSQTTQAVPSAEINNYPEHSWQYL